MPTWNFVKKAGGGVPAGAIHISIGNDSFLIDDGANSTISTTSPFVAGELSGHPWLQQSGGSGTVPAAPVIEQVMLVNGVLSKPAANGLYSTISIASVYLTPSGGDDAPQINAAISANCDIFLGPGVFVLNSPLVMPRGATGVRIRGSGRYTTMFKPSAGALRVIDFPYVADYDTYQNVTLEDFGIDASNLAVPTVNQSLVGNLINGTWKTRANFKNIVCRRINVTGLVTNATVSNGVYQAFSFGTRQGSFEATQNTLTGFTFEDISVAGGNYGFAVMGDNSVSAAAVNVLIDDINWNRLTHDSGTVPIDTNFNAGGNQIGGYAFGGTYRVTDCKFTNALDVGLELDAPQFAVVRGCVGTDARNANFFARNFGQPVNLNSQTVIFRDCHGKVVNSQPSATGHTGAGFQISHSSAPCPNLNHMIVDDCTFTTSAPQQTGIGQAILCNGYNVNRITIRDFTAVVDGCADTSTAPQSPNLLLLRPATACHTSVFNLTIRASGSTTNGSWQPSWFRWGTTGTSLKPVIEIDGVSITQTVTGVTSGNSRFVQIGSGGNSNSYRGTISRFTVDTITGDTAAKALSILSAVSNMAIDSNGELLVSRCDFTQNNGYDVIDLSTNAANLSRVVYRDNKWGPTGPSNQAGGSGKGRKTDNSYFATATFTTATGNQYLGGFSSRIIISGGAGVTAIDISQDGGSTYDNLLTQAAAAIPQPIIARLENGDFLKLTFTTTAPTVAVLPDK